MMRHAVLAAILGIGLNAEHAWARQRVLTLPDRLNACIDNEIKDYNTGHACIGRHAKECIRVAEQQETMLPDPCYVEEEQAWIGLAERFFAQRPKGAKGRRIAGAQRAWIAYRDAKCGAIRANLGGSLGRWQSAICRMEEAGRQALFLRAARTEAE